MWVMTGFVNDRFEGSQLVLKRDHVFVDTVGLGTVETPTKVYTFLIPLS